MLRADVLSAVKTTTIDSATVGATTHNYTDSPFRGFIGVVVVGVGVVVGFKEFDLKQWPLLVRMAVADSTRPPTPSSHCHRTLWTE